MDTRYERMIHRVGVAFYRDYLPEVRAAVHKDEVDELVQKATCERTDLVTVKFRIHAIASAVRQGYDL